MNDEEDPTARVGRKLTPQDASAEERLRGLIALSTEAIVSTDGQRRIILFNRGAEEVFGYRAADVLGRPLSMLLPLRIASQHDALVDHVMREENVSRRMGERRPVYGRRRNGDEFEAMISFSTLRTETGVVATAIIRDVSELRATERALRESEASFRTMVDASPAGLLTARLDGRVIAANPAFARLLKASGPVAVRDLALPPLFLDPEAWPGIAAAVQRGLAYPATAHRIRSLDATEVDVLINAVRVPGEHTSEDRIHVFVLDVTERRRLQETVRQTEQLDLVGRLAGGVAHDFNNLLLVIQLEASMLAEETGLSEQGREDLASLERAAVRAGELTQQLLAIGRRQVMRPAVMDLGALVTRLADLQRRLLGEDVVLRLEVGNAPVWVMADETQMERVLVNLASNARDAMPRGGMVELLVERREPDSRDRQICPNLGRGEWVHLAVSDSGSGMDDATRARAFDPFFSTKEPGRGTGLGLASVYGIITQSEGQVGVESEPGRGTTFHVWLPAASLSTAEFAQMESPSAKAPVRFALPVTVLLVEDEPDVRAGLERVLTGHGITVLTATGAQSAFQLVATHVGPLDAVISDIVLPGLSGQRVVDWIAERHPDVRVLFISGYSPETAHHRGTMRSGSAFLAKPFDPEKLLRALSDLLAGR